MLDKKPVQVQANGDNGAKLQALTEHALVRTFTPIVVFAMMGIIGWLFSTVLEIDESVQQHTIHLQHLHDAEEKFGEEMEEITKTLTDIRINVGRLTAH